MKHLFIINPVAGKGRNGGIPARVAAVMEPRGLDFACVFTASRGDATRIAAREAAAGGEIRLYACGGDGTLNEVVCGAAGHPNAAVTHFPCGSGNDFIKIFGGDAARFFSLEELLDADEAMLDLIDCNGRLVCSLCSIGFDARVGIGMSDFKKLPFISGAAAYRLSLLKNCSRTHRPYRITLDGEDFSGEYSSWPPATAAITAAASTYPPRHATTASGVRPGQAGLAFYHCSVVGHYQTARRKTTRSHHLPLRPLLRVVCDRPSMVNVDGERLDATDVRIAFPKKSFSSFIQRGNMEKYE
jgi:diacylglycerol kinase family enzyme